MRNLLIGILIGIVVSVIFEIIRLNYYSDNLDNLTDTTLISKINELTLQVDSLKYENLLLEDSIDTVFVYLERETIKYEKEANKLITLPIDSQLSFYSNYLRNTEWRYSNYDYKRSISSD